MRACANCHNQIPEGSGFCPHCGQSAASMPQNAPDAAAEHGALHYTTNRGRRRLNRRRIAAVAGSIFVLAAIAVAVQSAVLKSSAGRPAAETAVPAVSATAPSLAYPANGYIFSGWAEENACPLTIQTEGELAYFVKLVSLTGEDAFAFFVQPGQTVDTMAPLGRYVLKYASGVNWYGVEDLFGAETVYTRADGFLDFIYSDGSYNGWTIMLYTVADGNLGTDLLAAGDF